MCMVKQAMNEQNGFLDLKLTYLSSMRITTDLSLRTELKIKRVGLILTRAMSNIHKGGGISVVTKEKWSR